MEEKEDKIIVKWAQEDVETSNNLVNNNNKQQMHNYLTNYCTATCFDTIVSTSGSV